MMRFSVHPAVNNFYALHSILLGGGGNLTEIKNVPLDYDMRNVVTMKVMARLNLCGTRGFPLARRE
jgi:hypothetical protein